MHIVCHSYDKETQRAMHGCVLMVWWASETLRGLLKAFSSSSSPLAHYYFTVFAAQSVWQHSHNDIDEWFGALENTRSERTKNRFRFANNTVWFCECAIHLCVLHTETTDFVYMVYDVAMCVCRNIALSPASEATFHCHFNLLIKYEERTKKSIILRAFQFYNEQHVDAVRYFYWQKKENHF